VDTSYRKVEFPRDGIDLGIRMGKGDWDELYSLCLMMEELVPVCTPEIAATITSPDDLKGKALLHLVNVTEDWEAWAELAGLSGLDLGGGLRLDTIQMVQEAAAQGLGIAIGRLPLVQPELQSGRLVPVLGPPRRARSGYWLVAGRESLARPEVIAFRDWIRGELKAVTSPHKTS
ncbi:MAG: LysR family transcriptional regulator, partial [Magnetospirillum sp.]|nr:LysR family transcriptional regulator [Magnetospirillum sp.]